MSAPAGPISWIDYLTLHSVFTGPFFLKKRKNVKKLFKKLKNNRFQTLFLNFYVFSFLQKKRRVRNSLAPKSLYGPRGSGKEGVETAPILFFHFLNFFTIFYVVTFFYIFKFFLKFSNTILTKTLNPKLVSQNPKT